MVTEVHVILLLNQMTDTDRGTQACASHVCSNRHKDPQMTAPLALATEVPREELLDSKPYSTQASLITPTVNLLPPFTPLW